MLTKLPASAETIVDYGWIQNKDGSWSYSNDGKTLVKSNWLNDHGTWYYFDASDENAKVTPLNIVSKHFDFTDYGSIVYETDIATCPICGVQDHEIYVEKFILNDDYENAEIINEQLEQEMQEELAFVPDEATMEGEH